MVARTLKRALYIVIATLGVGMALGATLLAQASPGWSYGACLFVGAVFPKFNDPPATRWLRVRAA